MSYTKEQYKEWLASKPEEYQAALREKKRLTCAKWYRDNHERSARDMKRYYGLNREKLLARSRLQYARKHGQPWARMPAFYPFEDSAGYTTIFS